MAGTTIEALKAKHNHGTNVRKGLNVIIFMAPASAKLPDKITDTNGQVSELPAEYLPVGMMTTDGVTFSADVSKEEVEALGYVEPVRTDVVKAPKTIKFGVLETLRKNLQELVYGVDLSSTTAAASGEIIFDEAPMPQFSEFRLVAIMADGPADNEWLLGRGFPRVKLASVPEEVWSSSDPVKFDLELDVFTDTALGTPCRHYIGGTGALTHLDAIGFTKSA